MVAQAPCPACKVGNHAEHDAAFGRVKQPSCPIPCDSDCDATCHEEHLPRHKRTNCLSTHLIIGGYHCPCPGDCPPANGVWDGEFWWSNRAKRQIGYPTETCIECGLPSDYCGCGLKVD